MKQRIRRSGSEFLHFWKRGEKFMTGRRFKLHWRDSATARAKKPCKSINSQSYILIHPSLPRRFYSIENERRSSSFGCGQWIRYVQGRFQRRRCSPRRLPLHRGSPPSPGRHGRYGKEGLVRRRWSPVQARYSVSQVPHRARYRHQLGRYGEDLAPHLLQRTACCPRRTPRPPHWSSPQPQGKPRKDDTGNLPLWLPKQDTYNVRCVVKDRIHTSGREFRPVRKNWFKVFHFNELIWYCEW